MRSVLRSLVGAAVVVVVAIAGFSSAYEVRPGRSVLLLRGGKVIAGGIGPGLHWKIPLLESVVRLDERVQLTSGRATVGDAGGTVGQITIGYSIAWKIASPEKYYSATGAGQQVVEARLNEAVERSLRDALGSSPLKFLERPAGDVESSLDEAAGAAAHRLGIAVLGIRLGATQLPPGLQKSVAQQMAAAVQAESAAVERQTRDAVAGIEAGAAQQRASIEAGADREALQVRAESERRAAAIYADAARAAPDFFRFYHALQSERAQLMENTRVLVVSAASPWFEALQPAGGH